ncbi:hypothetical protein ALQ69_04446, partial [Pseudomonas savastanoi pv. glycinea]
MYEHASSRRRPLAVDNRFWSSSMETVRMTDQKGALISAQTEVGTYTSDSQHIRDLIRREQARSADIEATR